MRGAVAAVCVLLAGCGGSSPSSPSGSGSSSGGSPAASLPPGPLSFTFPPMDPAALQYIVPLGQMGPWGHTLPTDHIYFYHHFEEGPQQRMPFAPVPITMPATGTIMAICCGGGTGLNVFIQVNGTFAFNFDHIDLRPGLSIGSRVEAGSPLGTSPARCRATGSRRICRRRRAASAAT